MFRKLSIPAFLCLLSLQAMAQAPDVIYCQFNEGSGTNTQNSAVPGRGNSSLPLTGAHSWLTPGNLGAAAVTSGPNGDPILTGWATDIGTSNWTVEFWMRSISGSLAMYACGDTTAGSWRVFKGGAVNSTLGIRMTGGGLPTLDIPNVADGTWHHVAWVYDSTAGTLTSYRDGTQGVVKTGVIGNIAGSEYVVGNDRTGNNTRNFDGDLDEFRFWASARSQAEIQSNMNVELGDPPDMSVEYNSTVVAHLGNVNVGDARTQIGDVFTFDILNDASAVGDLNLFGTPAVSITPGLNCAAGTNVQAQPGLTTIPPSGSTSFTINIEPSAPGPFDLVVSIPNNDPAKNPFTFTIEGNGILPNDHAYSDLAAGSVLTSGTAGFYETDFDPGASLANVTIELLDPESDNITITAIDPPLVVPTGIVAPSIPGTPGHPVLLEWTGTADASNDPGDYTWTVHFEDAVNGTSVQAEVTITINDLPPVRAIAGADSGSGTAADPYFTTFTQGDDGSASVDMASVSDPNTSQALNVVNISQGANPTGGVGFQINFNAGIVSLAPNGSLSFDDAGTHTFTVQIGDGTNIVGIVLAALVYSTSGAITFDTPNPLPDGEVNQPYSLNIQVSGATAPTFNLQSGSLPTGITLSAAGVISGTPLATGVFTFTVRVLDGIDTATQQYDLEIKTAPPPPTGGSSGSSGGGGCAAAAGASWLGLILLGLPAAIGRRRRGYVRHKSIGLTNR